MIFLGQIANTFKVSEAIDADYRSESIEREIPQPQLLAPLRRELPLFLL